MLRPILSLAILAMTCAPCMAASFDCKHAKGAIEMAICDNAGLSALDEALAAAYAGAQAKGDVTLVQQRAWLQRRDAECSGPDPSGCLRTMIPNRIDELNSEQPASFISLIPSNRYAVGLVGLPILWLDSQTVAFIGDRASPDLHKVSLFVWTPGQDPVALKDLDISSCVTTFTSGGDGKGYVRLEFGGEKQGQTVYYRFDRNSAQEITAAEYGTYRRTADQNRAQEDDLKKEAVKLAGSPKGEVSAEISPDHTKALVWIDPTYLDATRPANLAAWSSQNCWPFYEVQFASKYVRKHCVPYGGWNRAHFYPLPTASRTFMIGTASNEESWESRSFGIYRTFGGQVLNLLPGQFISRWAVSPDGCMVALMHQDGREVDASSAQSKVDAWDTCH